MARSNNNSKIFKAIMLWIIFIALCVAIIKEVKADSLDIIMASHHLSNGEYNESNPGLGYNHNNGFTAGFYKNSYSKLSVFAGGYIETKKELLNVGIMSGLITGYKDQTGRNVGPMALPYVLIGPKAIRARIGALPGAVTFSLQVKI